MRAIALRRMSTSSKPTESYTKLMDKTGRPISPHVFGEMAPNPNIRDLFMGQAGIYRLPAIAWSSIVVRITGVMASAGFFLLGGATMVSGGPSAVDMAQSISEAVSPTATKFTVAFVLSYQWFGSARHAYWDATAKGFNNQTMLHSAYGMWAVTLGLSAALAFYALPPFATAEASGKQQKKG